MLSETRTLAVLGSTGSIGTSTLDVARASQGSLKPLALSAHSNLDLLVEQAREFQPRWIVAADEEVSRDFAWPALPNVERLEGAGGLQAIAEATEVDCVVAAIVGSAGLESTLAALRAGKRVALANKEALVVAGALVRNTASRSGGEIIPVDSEHSALFQAIQAGQRREVERIVLTASGGPFRSHSKQQLEQVSIEEALCHPTWSMGAKVTVDSATMMNKALEIIEARWLFDIGVEQIGVMVHPQSIVHSMVEFVDGSVIAQCSPPDMRLPIQYALTYPDRCPGGPTARFDWSEAMTWEFHAPDPDLFPAIPLGLEVAEKGGTAGVVMNAANEAAVAKFLAGELRFVEIVPACRAILENHDYEENPTLERLQELDCWAREELNKWTVC